MGSDLEPTGPMAASYRRTALFRALSFEPSEWKAKHATWYVTQRAIVSLGQVSSWQRQRRAGGGSRNARLGVQSSAGCVLGGGGHPTPPAAEAARSTVAPAQPTLHGLPLPSPSLHPWHVPDVCLQRLRHSLSHLFEAVRPANPGVVRHLRDITAADTVAQAREPLCMCIYGEQQTGDDGGGGGRPAVEVRRCGCL